MIKYLVCLFGQNQRLKREMEAYDLYDESNARTTWPPLAPTGPHVYTLLELHASTCARRHWLTPKFFMFGRSHKRSLACSPRLKNCQIILLAASLVNWFLLMFEWVCGSCLDERLSYDIGIKIGKGQRYGEGCIARWPALNLVECDRISMIVDRRC